MPDQDLTNLTLPEREALKRAYRATEELYDPAERSLAGAIITALTELDNRRERDNPDTPARTGRDGIEPIGEYRDRLRVAIDRLTRNLIIRADVDLDDVHAIAAAALAYTRLGGDLELPATTADAGALEAEVRVSELETAIGGLLDAVVELGPARDLLMEGRAKPVGDAIATLAKVAGR